VHAERRLLRHRTAKKFLRPMLEFAYVNAVTPDICVAYVNAVTPDTCVYFN